MLSFAISKSDSEKLIKIVDRAKAKLGSIQYSYREMMMDLTACHANGCRLDLDAMLAASEFDLMHDVLGIRNHLDRKTGRLMNFFEPRLAVKVSMSMPFKDFQDALLHLPKFYRRDRPARPALWRTSVTDCRSGYGDLDPAIAARRS
jgi:hypothetical protein